MKVQNNYVYFDEIVIMINVNMKLYEHLVI